MVGVTTFRRIILIATAVAGFVKANELDQRQLNPDFITVLPTVSSSSIAVASTTVPSDPPADVETVDDADSPPLETSPLPTSVPLEIPSTPTSSLIPLPADSKTARAGKSSASHGAVGPVRGPYFGGIPVFSPDVALVSILLNLFFLGAVVHSIERLQHSRRSRHDGSNETLSGVVACFCVVRVVTCALRLAWLDSRTSVSIIFLELVTENAGTGLMFFLNYRMARRIIVFYNIRLSLWAKSFVDATTKIGVVVSIAAAFILDTVGLVLFVLRPSGGPGPETAIVLVQASAATLLVLGLSLLGAVVGLRAFANQSILEDRGRRMSIVFFTGAGLFTMTSHLVRTAATFFIWKPKDAASEMILSKEMYYSTGFGLEVLTVAFYTAMKIDLLFSKPLSPTGASQMEISEAPTAAKRVSEVSVSEIFIQARDMEDGRHEGRVTITADDDNTQRIANPPFKNEKVRVETYLRAGESDGLEHPEIDRASCSMSIAIYKSF